MNSPTRKVKKPLDRRTTANVRAGLPDTKVWERRFKWFAVISVLAAVVYVLLYVFA